MAVRNMHPTRYEHYYAVSVAYRSDGSTVAYLTSFQFNPRQLTTEEIPIQLAGYAGRVSGLVDLRASLRVLMAQEGASREIGQEVDPDQGVLPW